MQCINRTQLLFPTQEKNPLIIPYYPTVWCGRCKSFYSVFNPPAHANMPRVEIFLWWTQWWSLLCPISIQIGAFCGVTPLPLYCKVTFMGFNSQTSHSPPAKNAGKYIIWNDAGKFTRVWKQGAQPWPFLQQMSIPLKHFLNTIAVLWLCVSHHIPKLFIWTRY